MNKKTLRDIATGLLSIPFIISFMRKKLEDSPE